MKATFCLVALCLIGWAASEHAFKVGKTYTYEVRGRLANGLTEIATQYAGLEIHYKVLLTVTGPNVVNFKPTDMKFFEVNDVIKGGWKEGELPNERPVEVAQEFGQYIESPMDIVFNKGVIESIKVQGDLPTWAINIKKAQASNFILDTTGVNLTLEGNLNRKTDHELPEERNMESGFFYQTLEKTVYGECETYYTVSQNGAFNEPMPFHQNHQAGVKLQDVPLNNVHVTDEKEFVGELPWHTTFHKFCNEKDQVYEIIKTVNFTACKNKPVLSYVAPSMIIDGRTGDNNFAGSIGIRIHVSRILACGQNREEFTILKMRHEEEVKVGLHLEKKIMTGAILNFTLVQITDVVAPVLVKDPKVITNLVYNFVLNQENLHHKTEEELPQMDASYMMNYGVDSVEEVKPITEDEPVVLPKPTLNEAPVNSMLITPLKVDGLKKRVVVLVREIGQDILNKNHDDHCLAEKGTLSKMSIVSKILRYLSYNDIQELYTQIAMKHQTDEEKIFRRTFLDCVAVAGTNPNIKFLFDLIMKKEITGEIVSEILMSIPMYIRTPTQEILNEYFKLVQSEVLRGNKQVLTTAILSFSTVLYEACINTHIFSTRFPVALYGKFCDAQTVEQEYLPYFIKELERLIRSDAKEDTHWKLVYLTAVGNIGHPVIVPVIQRYLDNVQTPIVKTRAVFALKHLIIARSNLHTEENKKFVVVDRQYEDILTNKVVKGKVLPILLSVAFDKGEHPDVRMAAITLIFHSSAADITVYQQLAYMTWFPASNQVHSFIYHSIKSMAALERPVHPVHYRLQNLARQVLTLCKPITIGYQSSRTIFNGDYITEFLTGYFSHFEYYGSKDSIVPNMIYYRQFFQFGGEHGLGSTPVEFRIHGNTLQKLFTHFVEQFFIPTTAQREAHDDLAKIHDLLSIKDRKQQENIEGYFYLKIRNEMERFITVNKEVIEQYTKDIMNELLPKLRQGLPINYQKTLRLAEYTMEFPTIFGFPLNYKHRMPVHFNIRGNLKWATEETLKDFQIQAELHPTYTWKTHDKLSVKVPFLNKKFETGFQNQVVVQFPFRALIRMAPRKQVTVAITPTHIHEQTPNTPIRLFTVHRVPYTAVIVDECWPLVHTEVGQVKVVKTLETLYQNEKRFGENKFGLSFLLHEETDYIVEKEGMNSWFNFWTKFHNIRTFAHLGWLAPSTKYAKRSLTIDMAKSQTKTFVVVVGGKWWKDQKNVHDVELIKTETTEEHVAGTVEHVLVVALIGKKTPIKPLTTTTGIQKILIKGVPSTFHYLAHFEYVKAVHGKFNLRLVAGEPCKEAVAKFPTNIPSLVAIREYIMDSRVEVQQLAKCVEIQAKLEVPTWANPQELVILRKRLLAQELVLNKNVEIKFGNTCNQMPQQIKIKGAWKRSQKMTEWAREKSPEAKRCIEDEKKGFQVSPICLKVSEQQAAALNLGEFEIDYTENIPVWFKNITYKVEDLLKATLYTYMQHNRFPEQQIGNLKMKVHFEMTPNKEYITLHIVKPTGHIEFRNIKTAVWAQKLFPLTATQSLWENVKDRSLRFYSEQSCTLEGKFVSTFDNVTYTFGEKDLTPGCTHLLAKDCTSKYPMAVHVNNIHTERKAVTVIVGKTKIIITPGSTVMNVRRGNFKVQVNEQVVTDFPKVIRHPQTNEFICVIEEMINGGIQVRGKYIKVATDGARVVLYGHNLLKNKVCGICGNADYEKNAEYRSPKNCPLSTGSLLVASYAFDTLNTEGRGQCKVLPEIKALIEKENADCLKSTQNLHIIKNTNVDIDSSEEYNKFENVETTDDDCNIRQRITKRFPGVGPCYSEKPVRQCAPGCYAQSTVEKEVKFQCYTTSRPTPFAQYITKQFTLELPTLCVRA